MVCDDGAHSFIREAGIFRDTDICAVCGHSQKELSTFGAVLATVGVLASPFLLMLAGAAGEAVLNSDGYHHDPMEG